MTIQLKPLALVLCLAGCIAAPVFAADTDADSANAEPVSLTRHKNQTVTTSHQRAAKIAQRRRSMAQSGATNGSEDVDTEPSHKMNRYELMKLIKQEKDLLPFDLSVPGQAFVSTGPYVGVPIQFSGSNLLVNSPSINTDSQLLGIRKKITEQLHAMGGEIVEEPYHSHLLLSGVVEGQANYNHVNRPRHEFENERRRDSSDIDVTNVSLDAFFIGPSPWLLGFIEMMYDGSEPANSVFDSNIHYRVSNSRVLVNKAFITIGDFTQTPWYGTLGQSYVPFGLYSSVMISDPLTKLLGRTKARYIQVGYQPQTPNNFYGAAYIFRGDTRTGGNTNINNGGINFGWKYSFCDDFYSGNFGGGYIANIADSGGMQLLNGDGFAVYEKIHRRVSGGDLRGIFSIGKHIDLIAEWVTSLGKFAHKDMTYKCHGAHPWALDTQASYSFKICDDRPSSIGIGYARSHQALALRLPKDRYSLGFNTSVWRNTLQRIEFRVDHEYGRHTKATGAHCSRIKRPTGRLNEALTAQFDYYF